MGRKFTIDRQSGIVYSTLIGEVNEQDLLDQISEISSSPDFDPAFSEIIDCSQVTSFNVSSDAIRNFAQQGSSFSQDAVRVIIASQDLVFGMARMFQSLGEESRPKLNIVRTWKEAQEYLKRKKHI